MEETSQKDKRPTLLLNGDLLGLSTGTLVGGIVLALSFYSQGLDGLTAAVRAGLASVVTYVVVFLFTKYVLHTLIYETAQQRVAAMEQASLSAQKSEPAGESLGEGK